jgi:hypothetical protein
MVTSCDSWFFLFFLVQILSPVVTETKLFYHLLYIMYDFYILCVMLYILIVTYTKITLL